MIFLLRRSISRPFSTSVPPLSTLFKKPDPLTRVNSILSSSHIFEPELDRIANLLDPQIASTVVKHPPSLGSGFRFFIWAMKYRHLRAWEINDFVIDILLKNGFDFYWEILEELKKLGIEISPEAFVVLISGYHKAGNAEKAVESFCKMKDFDCKPNVFIYNAILHVMVQKDVLLLALAVYNQMLKFNCEPDVATYSILINGFCKSGKIEDALYLFDEMTVRGILPNTVTYTIVVLGLCRAKKPYEAKELLGKMTSEGRFPDSITRDGILAGFCKSGKVDEAFLLLKVFEKQGYVLGINGYSCFIEGLFRIGRFEEAMKWFNKVVMLNISPDVVLYTIMIRGFCLAGKVNDAWKLFQEMTKNGVVPDTQCYNVLIRGLCHADLLEEALSLKLEISKDGNFPDTNTYKILICGMCENGLIGEAKHIFEEMEKLGIRPSVAAFNALINGLCKHKELEEARLLFYKMEIGRHPSLFLRLSQGIDRVMDKDSLKNLIARLGESGLYVKAYRLLTKLADNGVSPDTTTYNILINGMCRSGNIVGAFKIFRELQLKGVSPDEVTYRILINGLFKARRNKQALEMVKTMITSSISPTSATYKLLMTWSCRRRRMSMSFNVWLDYLKTLKNRDIKAIKLIQEHFEKGELEEAVRGLLKLDFETKDFDLAPYTIWLIGSCQARRVDDALMIFHVLQEFKVIVTAPSCVKLIKACCEEKKLDAAADILVYVIDKGFMIIRWTFNMVLYSMFRSQPHVDRAIDLINKMDDLGYDLNTIFSAKTKSLWKYHTTTQESATQFKSTTLDEMIESPSARDFVPLPHIQAMAFEPAITRKSCIIAVQSGSGKTLGYLVPTVCRS